MPSLVLVQKSSILELILFKLVSLDSFFGIANDILIVREINS
jgi:hypothetical protein